MKTLLSWVVILTALSGTAIRAQNIDGTWQGTLYTTGPSRLVLKISQPDGRTLKVDSYDLDNGAVRIPLNDATFNGSTLRFPLTAHSGNYTGKMSADGNTIVGTWKQEANSPSVPLTFTRATPTTAWDIQQPAVSTVMAPDAHPSFDVATIKPSAPDDGSKNLPHFFSQGRSLTANNVSLLQLIQYAYHLQPRQILGVPAWDDTTKFDIAGVPDIVGQPNGDQKQEMYQKLLAVRFKLSYHRDKKEFSVYALRQEKGGPKLAKSSGDPNESGRVMGRPGAHGGWTITCSNNTMESFASGLMSTVNDRQIVDQTGLKGGFDFHLTYAPDPLAPDAGTAPDIFHAVQQQLGLTLQPTTAPVEVLVIDHVERPSAN